VHLSHGPEAVVLQLEKPILSSNAWARFLRGMGWKAKDIFYSEYQEKVGAEAELVVTLPPRCHSDRLRQLVLWRSEAGNVIPLAQPLPKHLANILRENDSGSLTNFAGCAFGVILAAFIVRVFLVARD
jgi:hypothetical protein